MKLTEKIVALSIPIAMGIACGVGIFSVFLFGPNPISWACMGFVWGAIFVSLATLKLHQIIATYQMSKFEGDHRARMNQIAHEAFRHVIEDAERCGLIQPGQIKFEWGDGPPDEETPPVKH